MLANDLMEMRVIEENKNGWGSDEDGSIIEIDDSEPEYEEGKVKGKEVKSKKAVKKIKKVEQREPEGGGFGGTLLSGI